MNKKMKYFTSVNLPDNKDTHQTFSDIEDLLQQEHGIDGRHPVATESQAGFISHIDIQKLNRIFEWFQKNVINAK